ncbi:MAG: hypothetical protein KatS3mg110_0404 [Pirellulaceae bacterium]|nr:MAG: hypothetical protein KatS3mg110_0404 [Pirellulaceae bacterium]
MLIRLFWPALLVLAACDPAILVHGQQTEPRSRIQKRGTIDLLMVETTPIVFRGRLYRFEYVRANYRENRTGNSYFRMVDVETGKRLPAFASGYHLGCAIVEHDMVFVYGVDDWGGSKIHGFRSPDLEQWTEWAALELPGWAVYNTSVCKAQGRYVMAIELGAPADIVGVPFTTFFAESDDLIRWKMLPLAHCYSRDKYTACPTIRYIDDYYYMFYLESLAGPRYETRLVRSRDLQTWEEAPHNPVLSASPLDKRLAGRFTGDQRRAILQAININNSDMDLCEYQGATVIYYSWGNQQGTEFLAEAKYPGTLKELVTAFFEH